MFLEVTAAKHIKNYTLELVFNNGDSKVVDLEHHLTGSIFQPLKEIEFFKQFSIKYNTIEWANGADFAPEFLYEL